MNDLSYSEGCDFFTYICEFDHNIRRGDNLLNHRMKRKKKINL